MIRHIQSDRFAWIGLQVSRKYVVGELSDSRNLPLRDGVRFCSDESPVVRFLVPWEKKALSSVQQLT